MSPNDDESLTTIRRSALKMLARRDHSQFELQQKLVHRGYKQALIATVLNEYSQAGYINENRFTESFINWRIERGYGPLRIKSELTAKQIPDELIADQLKITDNAWILRAENILAKQFHGQQPQSFKEKAKQMRYLQQRGFTQSQINAAMKND